ncbi:MAG TPA: hypothetical protein VLI54_06740 [Bacillota bacterium]|nr:hypothetical protein [Bacillota bacterium]
MRNITYDPVCAEIFDSLRQQADDYRPTLVCGLYCPDADEVGLVQSTADAQEMATKVDNNLMLPEDVLLLSLKPPQGGIEHEDTSIASVFEREIAQEAGEAVLDVVVSVHGIRTEVPIIGGRPRDGKRLKTFGFVLGITNATPEMHPADRQEVSRAGWLGVEAAQGLFQRQGRRGSTAGRGERSLIVTDYIRTLFPLPPDLEEDDLDD